MKAHPSIYQPGNRSNNFDPPLFCKPFAGIRDGELIFLFTDPRLGGKIAFRSLQLATDMNTIHKWVSRPYARRFWQLESSLEELRIIYRDILANPLAHSFIGLYDNKMVCQVDLYHTSAEELGAHVSKEPGHCGLHILMLPPGESVRGLTDAMLGAFLRFYFSFGAADTLYGEPDARNRPAGTAALKAGFQFIRTITLTHKTASLYAITRQQFYAAYPLL